MKSLQEMIDVMEASKTKEIESCVSGENKWVICRQPLWNWGCIDYRVKAPLPFMVTFYRASDGKFYGPTGLQRDGDDSIEFIELTPEVKTKLGL